MPSRRDLANAVRALSMDAVFKKPIQATLARPWVWRISQKYCGMIT